MEEILKIGRKEYIIVSYFEDENEQFCVGKTLSSGINSYKVIAFDEEGKPYIRA